MDTSLFCPLWIMLHFYAYFLPKGPLKPEIVQKFGQFVERFVTLVPCPGCMHHATLYFLQHHHSLYQCKTGQHVFEWTVTFHNSVNERLQQRQFSMLEAESALLMHLSGKSKQQRHIESRHTLQLQRLRKIENRMLILQNKSHKIQVLDTTKQNELTQAATLELVQDSNAYDLVFLALLLIAWEKDQDKPMSNQLIECTQAFVQLSLELFPNLKIAGDSSQYMISNKPTFTQGSDFLNYIIAWKSHVTGITVTRKETTEYVQKWSKEQQKISFEILKAANEQQKKLITTKKAYDDLLETRKTQDASEETITNKQQNIWIYVLASISVVLVIVMVMLSVLYAREKKKKCIDTHTKNPIINT